jgi:hypothetical protein
LKTAKIFLALILAMPASAIAGESASDSVSSADRNTAAAQTLRGEHYLNRKPRGFSFRRITVNAGPNVSEFQGHDFNTDRVSTTVAPIQGFQAGIFSEVGGRDWVIDFGASYRRMGSRLEGWATSSTPGSETLDLQIEYLFDYMSIHAGGKYIYPASRVFRPYVSLGLVGSFLTKKTTTATVNGANQDVESYGLVDRELGGATSLGGRFYLSRAMTLAPEVSYYRSFTSLSSVVDAYNSSWNFGLLMGFEI